MFHRVKSEVQDGAQGVQQAEPPYRSESSSEKQETAGFVEPAAKTEGKADTQGRYAPPPKEEYQAPVSRASQKLSQQEENSVEEKVIDQADEAEQKFGYESRFSGYRSSLPQSAPRASTAAPAPAAPAAPSYPGAYAPQARDFGQGAGDRTLTIGRGINMSGEIEACDHLLVEGTVEAALKGAKVLEIAESGTFYGTVEIEEATIAGRFEGDITVNGRLVIRASGAITGSIAYRELEVEAGAMLDGRLTPLKAAADPKSADKYRAGSDASAMAKAKEIIGKKDNREPANAEDRLFSRASA